MEGNTNYDVKENYSEYTYSALDDPFDKIELSDSVIHSLVVYFTPLIKEYYSKHENE
ncbi:MAG: hypothetical protein IK097_07530 [Clostridia bacterium]|nr:hypothetical protein [Clostridia bacterium]